MNKRLSLCNKHGLFLFAFLYFAKKTWPFMRGRVISAPKASTYSFVIYQKHERGSLFMARSSRLESGFQDKLVSELKDLFPGCMTFKMDQIQGIPDLLVLYGNQWASLECKKSAKAKKQPNQEYYVGRMNDMSFSRFVYPENKEEVLRELQQTFKP